MKWPPTPKPNEGNSLVEFALILPVLTLILMGIVDFGRAIFAYSAISNGAREGARYGIVHPDNRDSDGSAPYDEYDTIEGRAVAQLIGLDPAQVNIRICYPTPSFMGCPDPPPLPGNPEWGYIRVQVTYDFYPVTPLIGSIWGGGPLELTARSNMHLE